MFDHLVGKRVTVTTVTGQVYAGELCRFRNNGKFWLPGMVDFRGRVAQPVLVLDEKMRVQGEKKVLKEAKTTE